MSIIAIRDLNEDATLNHTAMGELHGGKESHCPPKVPNDLLPRGDDHHRGYESLDLEKTMQGVTWQVGDIFANTDHNCPPGDISSPNPVPK